MKTIAFAALLFAATAGAAVLPGTPRTTNNDDSCDIAVLPAATLLVPYFEVDFNAPPATATTTLLSITNVTHIPQIAHLTIWSDFGFPVINYNIFLTGYDVHSINLYDVLARGVLADAHNYTSPGSRSLANGANPNFSSTAALHCSAASQPSLIPPYLLVDIRNGLTTGDYSQSPFSTCPDGVVVGRTHRNAIGYVTIDLVNTCTFELPTEPAFFRNHLLFDNVLIGDYMQVHPDPATGNYATANSMVHIRAMPEGGPAGATPPTNLPFTFHDRLTSSFHRGFDRRQPLPVTWAARFIEGGPGAFNTELQIWREGVRGGAHGCRDYPINDQLPVAEVVRFDEHENPTAGGTLRLPLTSSTPTSSTMFPPMSSPAGDVGGWLYINANHGGSPAYSTPRHGQSWVTVRMSAEGRYSSATDALPLGNGCSHTPVVGGVIGPAANETP